MKRAMLLPQTKLLDISQVSLDLFLLNGCCFSKTFYCDTDTPLVKCYKFSLQLQSACAPWATTTSASFHGKM